MFVELVYGKRNFDGLPGAKDIILGELTKRVHRIFPGAVKAAPRAIAGNSFSPLLPPSPSRWTGALGQGHAVLSPLIPRPPLSGGKRGRPSSGKRACLSH